MPRHIRLEIRGPAIHASVATDWQEVELIGSVVVGGASACGRDEWLWQGQSDLPRTATSAMLAMTKPGWLALCALQSHDFSGQSSSLPVPSSVFIFILFLNNV